MLEKLFSSSQNLGHDYSLFRMYIFVPVSRKANPREFEAEESGAAKSCESCVVF